MKNTTHTAIGAILALSSMALAQPGVQKMPPPAAQPYAAPQPFPPHEPLASRDAEGHVIPITGCLDALALKRNPLIDATTMEQLEPAIKDWTADVNQLVVDNVDLLERLDAGLLESSDNTDLAKVRLIQMIISQLSSAGQLNQRLMQQGKLELRQAQLNMQMTNEYVQAMAQELIRPPSNELPQVQQQIKQTAQAQAVNRWYQSLSMRDTREQYRRILVDSAGMIDQILPTLALSSEERSKVQPKAAAVKAAGSDLDKLVAVRSLLDDLSFDQRRAYLGKAVAMGAAPDPFHPAPAFPEKAGAAAPSDAKPAAAASPASPAK